VTATRTRSWCAAFGGTDAGTGTEGDEHATGSEVTVTWLIHDVSIWRVDRVYPDSPGGPWLASQTSFSGDIWSSPVQWHSASQGKALTGLLTRLGLLDDTAAAPPANVAPPGSATVVTPGPSARSAVEPAAADGARVPVWGAVGLTLGVALTVAALRVAGRRRQDEPEVTTREPTHDVLTSTGAPVRR
jgi:hypothetical protein